ncbi:hypothetical protein [Janthinobacterium lividum]|nr:hypothetical protein [Janthinobacterium lividum]NHQ92316.1 hypothetical protein [Janthinobacterium lividum]
MTPIGAPLLALASAGAPCYPAVFQELPGQEALPDGVLSACEAQWRRT